VPVGLSAPGMGVPHPGAFNKINIMERNNISIKETFDFLYLNERLLSLNQIEFIRGLQKYFKKHKTLSEKQTTALFEIRKYLPV